MNRFFLPGGECNPHRAATAARTRFTPKNPPLSTQKTRATSNARFSENYSHDQLSNLDFQQS